MVRAAAWRNVPTYMAVNDRPEPRIINRPGGLTLNRGAHFSAGSNTRFDVDYLAQQPVPLIRAWAAR
jgi:hypothetical protein